MRILEASYSGRGSRQWPEQRKVLDHLFGMLGGPGNEDVLDDGEDAPLGHGPARLEKSVRDIAEEIEPDSAVAAHGR